MGVCQLSTCEDLILDGDELPIELPADADCLEVANSIIANRFAPTIRHMADGRRFSLFDPGRGIEGRADLIISPFYDGDFNTGNNWNNLDEPAYQDFPTIDTDALDPYVYYSVVWLEDYWVVTYGFYHARDWAPNSDISPVCDADSHENDYEAAIFMVSREAKEVVSAHSIAHFAFLKYDNLNGITPTVFIDDRTHAVELNLFPEVFCIDYGLENSPIGPSVNDCDDCKIFFDPQFEVVYQPLPENDPLAEPFVDTELVTVDGQVRRVGTGQYELVDVFGSHSQSLNNFRDNPTVFTGDRFFHVDSEHPEAGFASAPWGLGNMSYTSEELEYITCFAETGEDFWCFPQSINVGGNIGTITYTPPPYPVNVDYNPFFPCPDPTILGIPISNDFIFIDEDTEWGPNSIFSSIVFQSIRIRFGATLTINNVDLNFKSGGSLIVDYGNLIINNSTLSYCGIEGVDGWNGIRVDTRPNSVTINNSIIDEARTGLQIGSPRNPSQVGCPIVNISNESVFLNNGIGIRSLDCDGQVNISDTEFSDGIGIELIGSQNFTIDNCSFSNHPTGISAINSAFEVINESSFENCGIGVVSVGTFPLGSSVYIGDENPGSGNTFDGTDRGILLIGTNSPDGAFIKKNEFSNTRNAIEFNGANKFTEANNSFMGNSRAVTVANTGIAANDLRCNEYISCTQANNLFTGINSETRFFENHSIASAGFNYILLNAELPLMIGENGESAANCFGENIVSFMRDIVSNQPFNYFYSTSSTDCNSEPTVGNNNVTVTEVLEEGVYCEEIGPFSIENPGDDNGGQIDLQNFEAESVCRTCILDSIDLYIDKVVAKGGNNPRTVVVETGVVTDDLPFTERILDQWIDFGIYVGLQLKDYEYLENILSPMKTWDLQSKHFGVKMIKNDLAGAQAKLASMPANNITQVYFKEVQGLNLRYLEGFDNENKLTATDLEDLRDIAYSKNPVSGYAKGLFLQITGTYLSNEYPELEEMANYMQEQAEEKETNTYKANDQAIRIFPNPTTDRLEIISSDNTLISKCVLTDFSGSVVFQQLINKNSLTLDLQGIVPGIYLVKIIDEHGEVTIEKIIVNK